MVRAKHPRRLASALQKNYWTKARANCSVTSNARAPFPLEAVDQIRRQQLVGFLEAIKHVGVVTQLIAGFQRELRVDLDLQARIVLDERVAAGRFDQQCVDERRRFVDLVLEVDFAATGGA